MEQDNKLIKLLVGLMQLQFMALMNKEWNY